MKKLIIFFILIFLVPFLSFSQSPQPFKKAKVILVETADSKPVAFKKIQQCFMDHDFVISHANDKVWIIQVEEKTIDLGRYVIMVHCKGDDLTRIYLSGWIYVSAMGYTNALNVEYRKSKDDIRRMAFDVMDTIAKSYEGGEIKYLSSGSPSI